MDKDSDNQDTHIDNDTVDDLLVSDGSILEHSGDINDESLHDNGLEEDNETVGNTTFETTYSESENLSDRDPDDDVLENSEDDDDEETEPPKLKYSRINKLPPNFFNRDPISCCNFHEDYYIFATHSGLIHITKPDFSSIRTFKAHRASVLSIYNDGKFFGTGSMDGTVVIGSITDEKDIIAYDFKRPIHAVVLDRQYAKTRSFVSGGMAGKVVHSSKNWLGQRSDLVLDENNGPIVAIHTVDDIVLWMNDKGITIFHTESRQVIKVIERPEGAPRSDLYWPRVHALETDRILVAWANFIWCIRVSIRTSEDKEESGSTRSRILPSAATISFRAVQEKKVEIEHVFQLDSLIAGISSFKDDYWMILSYEPPSEENGKTTFNNPDLKLINSLTGEVDFEEEIGLKNIDHLGLNDFSLNRHIGPDATSYFIVCAKDGVIAQEVQLHDRLDWYVQHDRYLEAWEISEHLVTPIKRLNFGVNYVDNLVKIDDWEKAAEFLKQLLCLDDSKLPEGDTKSTLMTEKTSITLQSSSSNKYDDEYVKLVIYQWETWSSIFARSGHIDLLTDLIPTSPKLSLSTSIYNNILLYWMDKDVKVVVKLLGQWDPELYEYTQVENIIEGYLENQEDVNLRRSLADLYIKTLEPQKAVTHLVALKDATVIQFLSSHHLLTNFFSDLGNMIKIRFGPNEYEKLPLSELKDRLSDVVQILVDHRHEIRVVSVLKLMEENHLSFINYLYLEELKQIDEFLVNDLGNERVKLYSEFNRGKLLPLLMRNDGYDIDYAIQICQSMEYTEELVYLLGKIGENKRALMLIIEKLDNPQVAINFAKHQNDREAWDILLDYSMTKPAFIKALIETADDQSNPFYDPISIIKRIPSGIHIEGLKASVLKITENQELSYLMNQLILKLVYGRSESISKTYRSGLLKGFEIETNGDIWSKFDSILLYGDRINQTPELKLQQEMFPQMGVQVYKDQLQKIEHLEIANNFLRLQKNQIN